MIGCCCMESLAAYALGYMQANWLNANAHLYACACHTRQVEGLSACAALLGWTQCCPGTHNAVNPCLYGHEGSVSLQEEATELVKKKRTIRKPVPVETKAAGYSTKELEVCLNLLQLPHCYYHFVFVLGSGLGCRTRGLTVKLQCLMPSRPFALWPVAGLVFKRV